MEQLENYICKELGWCHCGSLRESITLLQLVLEEFDRCRDDKNWDACQSMIDRLLCKEQNEALYYSYLYMLHANGLIEHGGSIAGAWISERGSEVLEQINQYSGRSH